jgi:hypothetical protein
MGDSEMEHDGTSQNGNKLQMERDNEKIGKKREKNRTTHTRMRGMGRRQRTMDRRKEI